MRFPFSLTRSLIAYLVKKRLSGQKRFPLVLMLEPLHACNLACSGCGRIREYAQTTGSTVPVAECLAAVDDCGAPVVSICGGEPLIYPGVGELVEKITQRRKHVYLCTNGLLLEKKLKDFHPGNRLFLNVHLDGMEASHDRIVQRPGVFAAATCGIRAAKRAGFQVTTNTTIYKNSDMQEIALLFAYLAELGVDTLMIAPAYGYEVLQQTDPAAAVRMFMTRDEIHEKFRQARTLLRPFRLAASPIYLEFLRGERELECAAWANPTYNVRGWRGPCYLNADAHYGSYQELLAATRWERLGPGRDPRCAHCLVHCGFEPAAVMAANRHLRDALKMAAWQMIA
ncbi:MAG: adenosyl-hopene transferase HpnH [Thermoguttaceae bacterium]|jgi:hopanoid biosynthesis associated radical SAM protein HpnH